MLGAYTTLCNDVSKWKGFVHKHYRCNRCPTEYVIEVVRREHFEGPILLGQIEVDTHHFVLLVSRYIDFGCCDSPDELEWESLPTWPKKHFMGDWGLTEEKNDAKPQLDMAHLQSISIRFNENKIEQFPQTYPVSKGFFLHTDLLGEKS